MSIKSKIEQFIRRIDAIHAPSDIGTFPLEGDLSVLAVKDAEAGAIVPPLPSEDWTAALERQGYHPITFLRMSFDEL